MQSKSILMYACMFMVIGSIEFTTTRNVQAQTKSDTPKTSQEKAEAIQALLSDMHKDKKLNGTVLVSENSKVIYSGAFGYGNFETNEKLHPDSCFRLASVSKQFTAMGIMILKERGKLSYDDDIRKHLPGLSYEGVTIRHLLVHTGGLSDYMELFRKHWDVEKTAYSKDVLDLFGEHQPEIDFKPGEKYEYSNTGYSLLGNIIINVSGLEYAEYMKKNVFGPLGMNDTFCSNGEKDQPIKNRVSGYNRRGENIDFHYLNGIVGDGGIYSTTADMFKWDQGLYTEKLVKKATLEEAFTPYTLNDGSTSDYGFGWTLNRTDKEDVVEHGGSWVGFSTYIRRDLKRGNAIIILTNMYGNAGRIANAVDKILKEDS